MSQLLQQVLVVAHVSAGLLALVAGPVAMQASKGGTRHRRAGRAFFYAMVVIFVTALALSAWRFHFFLVGLAFLSFYSAFSGLRALRLKRPGRDRPTRLDWGAALLQSGVGVAFLVRGLGGPLRRLLQGEPPPQLAYLVLFFGLFIVWGGVEDLQRFHRPPTEPMSWWYHHVNRMGGAYIAATTAFAVQTVAPWMPGSLQWLVWVAPALLGSLLITRVLRRDRRRFAAAARPKASLAAVAD